MIEHISELISEIEHLKRQIERLSVIEVGGAWIAWTPTITGGGSMTVSSVVNNFSKYFITGGLVIIKMRISSLTLGGTASDQINITTPHSADTDLMLCGFARFIQTTHCYVRTESDGSISMRTMDGANFPLGTSRFFILDGSYSI